jgi:hypothetical protein
MIDGGRALWVPPNRASIEIGSRGLRIDTIQHVAGFYLRLLPYWERLPSH